MPAGSSTTEKSIGYKEHYKYGVWSMKLLAILKTRESSRPEQDDLDPERETQGTTKVELKDCIQRKVELKDCIQRL